MDQGMENSILLFFYLDGFPKETLRTSHPLVQPGPFNQQTNDDANGVDFNENSGFVMNFFKHPQFDFGQRTKAQPSYNTEKLLIIPDEILDEDTDTDLLPFIK